MNTIALITATNELLAKKGSRLSGDTWVQIAIAVISVVACILSYKAIKKSGQANGLASEANRISKTTQALAMNVELLDRRKDILERINKCKPSELQLEDLYVRIIPEEYDDVSSNEIQLLFLDDEPINKSFKTFNDARMDISKACKSMDAFLDLCHHNNPGEGGIIWKDILTRYRRILEADSEGNYTTEMETEFQKYCYKFRQTNPISDQISVDYDFYEIWKQYEKSNSDFKKAQADLHSKIRGFIKNSIDPQKI